MRDSRHQHQALYDEYGNIILPENQESEISKTPTEQGGVKEIWNEVREKTFATVQVFVHEGISQYSWILRDCQNIFGRGLRLIKRILFRFGRFLAQPVWIIHPNRKPKKYSRGTLFVLDIVRFGGTFAAIFLVLFASMNYKSFWEIAQEKVNPIQHAQNVQEQTEMIDSALRDKLLKSPTLATAGKSAGNLLAYLPNIGPPENRLIIPKLGINVPLVTPSYQSLLKEDWEQVEADIQDALAMGVVHYPGTARPGQAGNFFMTGHSSYYPWAPGKYKSVFARLHNLNPGDEYFVYYGGDQHRYIIRSKKEVRPSNIDVLNQPVNKRISTLMTCTPVGTTLRRLILVAEEIDPSTGIPMEVGEQQKRTTPDVKPKMLPI